MKRASSVALGTRAIEPVVLIHAQEIGSGGGHSHCGETTQPQALQFCSRLRQRHPPESQKTTTWQRTI